MVNRTLIKILSIIDSYHDFYQSSRTDIKVKDKKNNTKETTNSEDKNSDINNKIDEENSDFINKLLNDNKFIEYLFIEINQNITQDYEEKIKILFNLDKDDKLDKIIKKNNIITNVNNSEYRKIFLNRLLKYDNFFTSEYEMLTLVDEIIMENFKLIFLDENQVKMINNYNKKNSEEKIFNNEIYSKITKIRLPLYYLIKKISNLDKNLQKLFELDINYYEKENTNTFIDRNKNLLFLINSLYNILLDIKNQNLSEKNKKMLMDINISDFLFNVKSNYEITFIKISSEKESLRNFIKKLLEMIINNQHVELLKYIIDKNNLNFICELKKLYKKLNLIVNPEFVFIKNFKFIINLLLDIIKYINQFYQKNQIEFENFCINNKEEIIIYNLIKNIINVFDNTISPSYTQVIKNIKLNFETIKQNKNITYPIGIVLQDSKGKTELFDNLDFKTLYPVHHEYYDASKITKNLITTNLDNNILQLVNNHVNNQIIDNDYNNIYNINLDHNDNYNIRLTSMNIDYYLSCIDNHDTQTLCDNEKNNLLNYDYDKDNGKVYVQKKVLIFSSNRCVKNKINGYCKVNSVNHLANILVLFIKFKNKIKELTYPVEIENNLYTLKSIDTKTIEIIYKNEIKDKKNISIEYIKIFQIKIVNDTIINYIKSDDGFYRICQIILSCKRFGDWYAQNLAKQNYFFVKTDDFWANIYGLVLGTPSIFVKNNKYYLYNYMPSTDLINFYNNGKTNIVIGSNKILEDFAKLFVYDQDSIINSENFDKLHKYEHFNLVESNIDDKEKGVIIGEFNRYYFNKYLKYKKKYLELKKNLVRFN